MDSERALLGCLMLGADAVVDASDFESESHRSVYAAIRRLIDRGVSPDHVTVARELGDDLASVGGKPYLLDLASAVPTSRNAQAYADAVRESATARRVERIAAVAVAEAGKGRIDVPALVASLERTESAVATHRLIGDVIDEVADSSVEASEYITLPEIGVRLRPGEVMYLAARPKIGKTALMVQEAKALADRHLRSQLYNYEMSDTELATRLIAHVAGVGRKQLDDGLGESGARFVKDGTKGDWRRFMSTVDRPLSLPALCSDIRRQAKCGCRIAFIDYLQLITAQKYDDVTEASRQIKLTAKAAGIPLVVLSQLSRVEGEPNSMNLRQSGALEQDADVVVLLHSWEPPEHDGDNAEKRLEYRDKWGCLFDLDDPRRLGYAKVALHRSGPTYTVPMLYSGAEFRWTAIDRDAKARDF